MNAVNKQHVQLPKAFSQVELEALQATAADKIINGYYRESQVSGGSWVFPAIDKESFPSFELAIEHAEKMVKEGRQRFPHEAPFNQGTYYSLTYFKPQAEIDALIKSSNEEVETQYKNEIEEFNQAQVTLLADQLYQAQKAKEEKIQREKEEKAKAKALEEAQSFINQQLKEVK